MKKNSMKVIALGLIGLLTFGAFLNTNLERKYKPDQYIPEENAYYGGEITDPAGHIKAHKFVTPTDNKYSSQKTRSLGTSLIGDIESVWSSYTGKGTTIAIIDDGFDYDHPEFTRSDGTSAILSTSRYYYESGNSYNYKKYSDDPTCIAEDWESDGDGGYEWATHGTATSTTAAAPMNNGGGVGIAPEADILALKIDFSFASIDGAIRYAVSQGVDVINMSLGAYAESFTDGWGDSQTGYSSTATYLNSACQVAYNAGVIVVAAAGNESTWHKSYPACNTKVIGVGALGDWDNKGNANKLAEFTNYVSTSQSGEINVDILAPGYVYTAERQGTQSKPTHTYDDTQGTSFSCPIIAGAACLWKQKYPNGTPDEFLSQLQSSADGKNYYKNLMIEVSGWYSSLSDVGPSNITNGRLNVANLLDISEPYVTTVQSTLNISVGEKKQINLDTYNGTITYSSSNTSVATVSSSGLVEGKGAGSTTITVTASKNSHTATATVTVNVAAIVACQSISYSPNAVTLEVGETYDSEPTITVTPSGASRVFLFESSDPTVASVDEDTGVVTAKKQGTATISAVAIYGSGNSDLTVTVNAPSTPSTWNKVTSDSDITSGADYLIVYEDGGYAFNGGLDTLDAGSNRISVTISNNKITYDSATAAAKFTIESMSGGYSIKSASGKYISGTSGKNTLNSGTSASLNTINISGGDADIVSNTSHLRFNSDASQSRFRYFKSDSYSNQKAIQLYKAAGGSTPTPTPTVSGVTVSPASLSLDLNGTTSGNLTATVNGTNSPAQTVTWSSNNTSIATVSNAGVVTAKATGTAIITATSTVDTTKSGTCEVTVVDTTATKTLLSISLSGSYPTSFEKGDTFSHSGMTVTANFSDSTSSDVTSSAQFTGYNMNSATTQTVTVSYTYDGVTKSATYQITVTSSGGSGETVSGSQRIVSNSSSTYYTSGSLTPELNDTTATLSCSAFSLTWAKNTGTNPIALTYAEMRLYISHSLMITPNSDYTITSIEIVANSSSYASALGGGGLTNCTKNSSSSNVTLTPTDGTSTLGFSQTAQTRINYMVVYYETDSGSTPVEPTLTSITLDTTNVKTSFSVDETFTYSGLVVTGHYSNGSSQTISSGYTVSTPDMTTAGNKTITVSYGGESASYTIVVSSSGGGGGGSSSGTYTIGWGDATGQAGTYTNFTDTSGSVEDLLSFSSYKNSASNAPAYNANSNELRLYYNGQGNGGYIEITPVQGVTFTGFVMETTTSPTVKYSVDGGSLTTVSGSSNTYTVSNISASSSIRIQNCNTTNTQLRISTIELSYELESQSDKIVSSLSASYTGGNVFVGGTLDESTVTVTANYTDSSKYPSAVLNSKDYSITGFSSATAGQKTVTVTYTGSLEKLTNPMTTTFNVTVVEDTVTNVSVTNTKTYHPGETISKNDITVTLTYASGGSTTTTDFTFANNGYQFTYADAPSGGSNGSKQFSITYAGSSYNFTVSVNRNAYQPVSSSTTTLASSQFESSDLSKSSGTASSTSVTIGGVGFTVTTNAYVFTQNNVNYVSFGSTAGSINNTSAFASDLTSVTIVQKSGARQDGVLTISKDNATYVAYSAAEIAKGGYRYFKYEYVGTSSASGAAKYSNIQSIEYTLAGQDNPTNVANYIMYEDTNNQCTTKLDLAIDKLNTMSSSDKTTFWTSNDYVIATARERLQAWARHEGKELDYSNGTYQVSGARNIPAIIGFDASDNGTMIFLITLTSVSLITIGGFIFLKKRKEY